jgi:hypothetical protein
MPNKKQALLTLHEHQGSSRSVAISRVARRFSVLYCLSVCALFVLLVLPSIASISGLSIRDDPFGFL